MTRITNETINRYGEEIALFIHGIVKMDKLYVSNNIDNPILVHVVEDDKGYIANFNNKGIKYEVTPTYLAHCYDLLSLTIEKLNLITVPIKGNKGKTYGGFHLNKLNYLNNKGLLCVDGLDIDRVQFTAMSNAMKDIKFTVTVGGQDFTYKPYTTRQLLGLEHTPSRRGKIRYIDKIR